jgi:peptide/nickel transport system permease protein
MNKIPKSSTLIISGSFIILIILLAIIGELIIPYSPYSMNFLPFQPPSKQNIFGTDDLGRDIFSRLVIGTRISLLVGCFSVAVAAFFGTILGLISSYYKKFEVLLMRLIEALWAIPSILLALSIAITMKPGITSTIIVIGIVYCPLFARLVFGQAVSIREREFVTAAKAIGCSDSRVIFRHMFPNLIAPIIVQVSLAIGTAIILESTLSFLGVGIQPPTPSWGVMITSGYIWLAKAPWVAFIPGIAIYLTVTSLNLIGDRIRIKLDPKQKIKGIGLQ